MKITKEIVKIEKIKKLILEKKTECVGYLAENKTTYEDVLENNDSEGYGEDSDNNNFHAGIISLANKILKVLEE